MNLDNIIDTYMPIAKPLSMAMERQKKHISLVVYKKKIIAVGQNIFKTHPKTIELGYRYGEMHSELDAFRKIPKNLLNKKLILLNFRFNRFGNFRNSKPCPICSKWCNEIFHKIYYTNDDGIFELE
jgi:hypothetical protein